MSRVEFLDTRGSWLRPPRHAYIAPVGTPPAVARWYAEHPADAWKPRTLADASFVFREVLTLNLRITAALARQRAEVDRIPKSIAESDLAEQRRWLKRGLGLPLEDR